MPSKSGQLSRRGLLEGTFLGLAAGGLGGCIAGRNVPAAAPTKRRTPRIASDWRRVVTYPYHHLNDFCLFKDNEGTWHATGIMGTGTWESEQSLFHCAGRDLFGPWKTLDPVLTDMPESGLPPQKHAPYVVCHDNKYYMYYRRPPGTILLSLSEDPDKWTGLGKELFAELDARDVHILRIGDMFHMYYCQAAKIDHDTQSCILMRRSDDLRYWSVPVVVHYDTATPTHHSYLESPCVVQRPEGYYLFIRHRLMDKRTTTVVLFSQRPDAFPSGERTWFCELHDVHAPEIVMDQGKFYIARVSGAPHASKHAPDRGGWIDIAELVFE